MNLWEYLGVGFCVMCAAALLVLIWLTHSLWPLAGFVVGVLVSSWVIGVDARRNR